MRIVRLCEDTPKMALRIVQPGCDGRQLIDMGVEIQISPVQCEEPQERIVMDVCLNVVDIIKREVPTLTYPAFEIDAEGRIVFYFDKRLWSQPAGRYRARVLIGGCCSKTTIDIDLCNRPVVIEQVAVTSVAACGGSPC